MPAAVIGIASSPLRHRGSLAYVLPTRFEFSTTAHGAPSASLDDGVSGERRRARALSSMITSTTSPSSPTADPDLSGLASVDETPRAQCNFVSRPRV